MSLGVGFELSKAHTIPVSFFLPCVCGSRCEFPATARVPFLPACHQAPHMIVMNSNLLEP